MRILSMIIVLAFTVVSASASYTILPSTVDLDHQYSYIWTVTPSLASGESITDCTLFFDNINDWRVEPGDAMYIRLLSMSEVDSAVTALGMSEIDTDVYRSLDSQATGDEFNGYGDLLTIYEDDNEFWNGRKWVNPSEDFTYVFSSDEVSLVNAYLASDGMFGIALDPDCHYLKNYGGVGIESVAVVPAPGGILLVSIGVTVVGWLRRRRTL